MTERMLAALGAALLVAGSTCAQAPSPAQPAPPPVVPAEPAMPADGGWLGNWEMPTAGGQLWLSADYAVGWYSGDRLPALVTTSAPGTARASAGIPGLKTTEVLFGDRLVNDDLRSGLAIGVGYWFTPERVCGIEASFMTLESQAALFAATSNGNTILARPYTDATTGANQAILVAFPGSSAGSIDARANSGEFYRGTLDLTENVYATGWFRFDSLFGYSFYRYDEGLQVRQRITNNPVFATGTVFSGQDDFITHNQFHGADLGFRTQFGWEDFSLSLLTKLGVGCVNRTVKIAGSELVAVPGSTPVTGIGNLLALPSNMGNHHSHDWTVLPELGGNLGWQAARNVRVTFGYSILLLDRIARASDQIDLTLNPQLFPNSGQTVTGPQRPAFSLNRADVTLQTFTLGVEVTY